MVTFAIVPRGRGPEGMASFMRVDPANGSVEVGAIILARTLQRTPAATEAMYLLAHHVFDALGYRRYEWKCDSCNEPSRVAAARLGFTYEGRHRNAMVYHGRNRDTDWFSITDAEWPRLRAAHEAWLDPANFDESGRQRTRLSRPHRRPFSAIVPDVRGCFRAAKPTRNVRAVQATPGGGVGRPWQGGGHGATRQLHHLGGARPRGGLRVLRRRARVGAGDARARRRADDPGRRQAAAVVVGRGGLRGRGRPDPPRRGPRPDHTGPQPAHPRGGRRRPRAGPCGRGVVRRRGGRARVGRLHRLLRRPGRLPLGGRLQPRTRSDRQCCPDQADPEPDHRRKHDARHPQTQRGPRASARGLAGAPRRDRGALRHRRLRQGAGVRRPHR